MEYVDGMDLAHLIDERGPLPVPLACEYIRQAALGLQYAHERGLVHCDIKPANLLVRRDAWSSNSRPSLSWHDGTPEPIVKILDLGVARFVSEHGSDAHELAGTPDFLAPERAHDTGAADIRSDLYSLGCTFYYLLTGQTPYPGGTWAEKLVRHHFETATPVHELRADAPTEVLAIVYRLMAKNPAARYQCPAEAARALEQCLAAQPGAETSAPRTCPAAQCATHTVPLAGLRTPVDVTTDSGEVFPVHSSDSPASRSPSEYRRAASWIGAVTAATAGLLLAWGLRSPSPQALDSVSSPEAAAHLTNYLTLSDHPGLVLDRLNQAVQQAHDGETIALHGSGPFVSPPLTVVGKALNLQAASGSRPRIELRRSGPDATWQALVSTDRPLTITGVDIHCNPTAGMSSGPETTHLIYSEGAPVRLVDCRLKSPGGQALVVCRQAVAVDVENCEFRAWALAVCVEVENESPPAVRLIGNSVFLNDPQAAAFSLWARTAGRHGSVHLQMKDNAVPTGRPLALWGLEAGGETALAYPIQSAFRNPHN
jgi:serine/threonine protein kinase